MNQKAYRWNKKQHGRAAGRAAGEAGGGEGPRCTVDGEGRQRRFAEGGLFSYDRVKCMITHAPGRISEA